jgi:thiamine-phosphate pyrophosphorylase
VLPRLYAILDTELVAARALEPRRVFSAWLDAGVPLVQLRAKTMAAGDLLALADGFAAVARARGARFIVNDRADIAVLAGAHGLHVGQEDLPPSQVRPILGETALVGLSTHSEAQVQAALMQPIDYLAIGPVFATASKARPDPVVGLAGVAMAAALARPHGIPVVAIGGITRERAPGVFAAGASTVAVISDLLTGDPAKRADEWLMTLGE